MVRLEITVKSVTEAATTVPQEIHVPSTILGERFVPTKDIEIDGWILPRLLREGVVDEYVEAIEGGAVLPLITVIELDATLFLVDGRHRLASYEKLGHKEINVRVMAGNRRDAMLAAILLNGAHGHKLTREEVRQAIHKALQDPYLRTLANTELARRIGTSHKTVERVKERLFKAKTTETEATGCADPDLTVTYPTKTGKIVTRKARNKKPPRTVIPSWLDNFKAAAKAVPSDDELVVLLVDGSLTAEFNRVASIVFKAGQRLSTAAYHRKGELTNREMLPVDPVEPDGLATENVEVCG